MRANNYTMQLHLMLFCALEKCTEIEAVTVWFLCPDTHPGELNEDFINTLILAFPGIPLPEQGCFRCVQFNVHVSLCFECWCKCQSWYFCKSAITDINMLLLSPSDFNDRTNCMSEQYLKGNCFYILIKSLSSTQKNIFPIYRIFHVLHK